MESITSLCTFVVTFASIQEFEDLYNQARATLGHEG